MFAINPSCCSSETPEHFCDKCKREYERSPQRRLTLDTFTGRWVPANNAAQSADGDALQLPEPVVATASYETSDPDLLTIPRTVAQNTADGLTEQSRLAAQEAAARRKNLQRTIGQRDESTYEDPDVLQLPEPTFPNGVLPKASHVRTWQPSGT